MGLRINKSFKIAPGLRVRLGSKSNSLSIGSKAGQVTMNSRGRRTTTVRLAPGVSYSTSTSTSSSGSSRTKPEPARPVPEVPVAPTVSTPLGPLIAPRRRTIDGWIAADLRGVVVHRRALDDVRIPLAQLVSAERDGKELTLKTSDVVTYRLMLTTFSAARDLHFVETLARAARLTQS
ncbi:DUF4236 domain-containing protein [Streptomyces sp. NPDC059215]|uniref:DUF4236 domain-containing protein n=1 Tax=Streptomyces sp. NPDC059215 TaxID=3346772 RepID=UPI0036CCDD14